jgi:hypothetical protein
MKRGAMRVLAIAALLVAFCAADRALAQNNCKICGDAQRACVKNHSRAACTTEYEICMKHCRAK